MATATVAVAVHADDIVAYQLPLGDCNVFMQAADGSYDGDVDGQLNPGTIIGYEHGTYTTWNVKNLSGQQNKSGTYNPITLIPLTDTNRPATYQSGSGDANFRNLKYVTVDGRPTKGDDARGFVFEDRLHWYDILAAEESQNLKTLWCEFDLNGAATIALKVTPKTDYVIDNIEVAHNYCRNQTGTGMYIGNPLWDSHPGQEEISNVEIHHNYIYGGTYSGIELKGAPDGVNSIHHNTILDINSSGSAGAESAIHVAQGTATSVYNNYIDDSEGNGIDTVSDRDGQDIYNNLIINCGGLDPPYDNGIHVHNNCGAADIDIYYNTIVAIDDYGIQVSGGATDAAAFGNVILDCNTGSIDQGGSPGANFYDNDVQEDGYTRANYDFVDEASDDFHIESTSPAVDSGPAGNPSSDLDNLGRIGTADKGAYEYRRISYAIRRVPAANGVAPFTQDITTTDLGGITPKAVILIATYATSNGTPVANAGMSYGAADGTNQWCVTFGDEDGQGTTDVASRTNTNATLIMLTPGTTAITGRANFNSFITNGVRVNWTTAPSANWLITAIFFGGDSLSAYAGNDNLGDVQDSTTDVTDPGFEPDVVLTACVGGMSSDDTQNSSGVSYGAVHNDGAGTVTQRSYTNWSQNGQASSVLTSYFSELYGVVNTGVGVFDWGGEFGTFDANGFSVTTRNNGANSTELFYLALNFGGVCDAAVGTVDTPMANKIERITGAGLTPNLVLMGLTIMDAVDTFYSDGRAGAAGIGVFNSSTEYSNAWAAEDNVGTSNTQSLADNVAADITRDNGFAGITADYDSMSSDGFNLDFTVVYALISASRKWWYLALE